MKASILICTKNSSRTIKKCLQSIFNAVKNINSKVIFEYLIIDGDSVDTTIKIIKPLLLNKDHQIHIRGDLSLSKSRYLGFDLASGDLVIQVDSDVYVKDDFLVNMLEDWKNKDHSTGVIEYGIRDWYYNDVPDIKSINYKQKHEKRAFFFVTVLDKKALNFPKIDLRHLEEEYVRRCLSKVAVQWTKSDRIVGDHYSSPDRYGGFGLSSIQRTRAFPRWTYHEEGYLNKITPSGKSLVYHLASIFYRSLNLSLLMVWFKSISNPFLNMISYLKGYKKNE